jgi:predicted HAD superfamily Cof-like phosphohydrolase|tara:strand:- start:1578 stop:1997 length:420 start_codon:yes stop_codon:yes gene_type:complete
MSKDWVKDIHEMHEKYGVGEWMGHRELNNDRELLQQFLDFRIKFLKEELDETAKAVQEKDPEEIVDGLIDLCVVAIGTLDAFGVDAHKAWDEVLKANMAKEVGVKEERPNPLGLPDLVKPEGWEAPSHEGNHDLLAHTF